MRRTGQFGFAVSLVLFGLAGADAARPAAQGERVTADMTVRADQPKGTISRNVYGQFAEHLGRLVYDGLWVGDGSAIPNTRGIRNDVIAALKNLQVPVLRWPGGCFADEYHWRDGIGPRAARPRRINTHWGGVIETNAFGTHEFMDLTELIGADAYISGNVGTGTPQELMEWIEYMTSDSDSTLAGLRKQNGRAAPWKVPYVGVGNESWGCGGNMRPEYYADLYRRYATFVKSYSGNRIQRYASGSNGEDYNWTDVLMAQVGRRMQGLSMHYYTLPTGNWDKKGSATRFDEQAWHATLARTLRMEELLQKHSAIMDKYDPEKRVGLIVDEWGTWYDVEPGTKPGFLYQQNSLRDAVAAAINLNLFHQHSDRVTMANIAQMVNVLQAMILTEKDKMLLTPTYHVFEMYKVHQDATSIPIELSSPPYRLGDATVPALHASASRDKAGRIHVSIVNLDPNRAAQVSMKIAGAASGRVTGRVLTAPTINAVNTFETPDAVRPVPFTDAAVQGDRITLTLPSKSVVVLEIQP
ncbi:MAG TPA: alpha-N-arabinofuranosidase [Vicinamibacterales bacterium]|nr:alpha-N-arabinofuranosidase [Vicinamibacterales bacterium]